MGTSKRLYTLAEHMFKTGHAVDLSQSEVIDQHQHTTTHCMLQELAHSAQPGSLDQGTSNPTRNVYVTPRLVNCFLH